MSEIGTTDFQAGLCAKCVIEFNRLPEDPMRTVLRSIPCRDGARGDIRLMRDTLGKVGRKSSESTYLPRMVPARAGGSKGNRKPNAVFQPRAGSKISKKGINLPLPPKAAESPVWRDPWKPPSALNNVKKLNNTDWTNSPYVLKSRAYFGRTATFNAFEVSICSIRTNAIDLDLAGCVIATGFGGNAVAGLVTSAKHSVFTLVSYPLMRKRFAVHGLYACVRSLQPATNSLLIRNAHKDGPQATRIREAWGGAFFVAEDWHSLRSVSISLQDRNVGTGHFVMEPEEIC